jgi:C_GCAxxG_C_C family probable redox protein
MKTEVKSEDRNRLAEMAYQRAFELDALYGCCPQCVLTAVKETTGDASDDLIKASHGLSGGGALMGEGVCGALTGGLLALGARFGRDADKLDQGRAMNNFQAGRKLVDRFQSEYGGVSCQHLQQRFSGRTWDFWKADEYKGFSDARKDGCARATGLVAKWVVEMMAK